jgi:hypothetical protein
VECKGKQRLSFKSSKLKIFFFFKLATAIPMDRPPISAIEQLDNASVSRESEATNVTNALEDTWERLLTVHLAVNVSTTGMTS